MTPLRYSINVTLHGCCDHRVMVADEESHRYWVASLERADAPPALTAEGERPWQSQPTVLGISTT
jgi:hypothetical protein